MAQNFNCGQFRIPKSVVFKSRRMYVSVFSLEKHQKPEILASLLLSVALFFLLFERSFWICFIIVHIIRPKKKHIRSYELLHKWQKIARKWAFFVILCYFNAWKPAVEWNGQCIQYTVGNIKFNTNRLKQEIRILVFFTEIYINLGQVTKTVDRPEIFFKNCGHDPFKLVDGVLNIKRITQ